MCISRIDDVCTCRCSLTVPTGLRVMVSIIVDIRVSVVTLHIANATVITRLIRITNINRVTSFTSFTGITRLITSITRGTRLNTVTTINSTSIIVVAVVRVPGSLVTCMTRLVV